MRKSVLFFLLQITFILSFGTTSYAFVLPEEAEYTQIVDLSKPLSTSVPTWLDELFAIKNARTYKFEGYAAPALYLDWINRVYASSNFKQLVYVKSEIEINEFIKLDRVYEADSNYLVHHNIPNKGILAFYFVGFDLPQVQIAIDDIKAKRKDSAAWSFDADNYNRTSLIKILVPDAHAAAGSYACKSPPLTESEIKQHHSDNTGLGCLKNMGLGAWGATGGLVVKGYNKAKDLAASPTETLNKIDKAAAAMGDKARDGLKSIVTASPKKVFGNVDASFSRAVNFSRDLTNRLGDVGKQINALPSSVKNKIICEMIGGIGTSMLVSFVSFGVASPIIYSMTSSILYRLAAGNRQIQTIALLAGRKGAELSVLKSVAPEVRKVQKEIKDKITEIAKLSKQLSGEERDAVLISKEVAIEAKKLGIPAPPTLLPSGAPLSEKAQRIQRLENEVATISNQNAHLIAKLNEHDKNVFKALVGTGTGSAITLCSGFAQVSAASGSASSNEAKSSAGQK